MLVPPQIQKAIQALASLPAIGPRQATRLAFYLLNAGPKNIAALIAHLQSLKSVRRCRFCYYFYAPGNKTDSSCDICADTKRDPKTICIVEKETDLLSLEKTHSYTGRYFVLGGHLRHSSTKPEQRETRKRLTHLKDHIEKKLDGVADEIIIGINPTSEGDLTAHYIKEELGALAKKISRLGRGIPTGGDIEFADEETLEEALKYRR